MEGLVLLLAFAGFLLVWYRIGPDAGTGHRLIDRLGLVLALSVIGGIAWVAIQSRVTGSQSAVAPVTAKPPSLSNPASSAKPSPSRSASPGTVQGSPTARVGCDPAYPDVCIPPPPPDLDCADLEVRLFRVLPPDPHRLDGNRNGIACE